MSDSHKKVLFVVMPWASVGNGSLGVSTLKAILRRDHIDAEILYLNIPFARRVGAAVYQYVSGSGGGKYRGDIYFTPHYYKLPPEQFVKENLAVYHADSPKFKRQILRQPEGTSSAAEETLLNVWERICCHEVPEFLRRAMEEIPWDNYDIVGFSLMFDQTLASLCLAQHIKERYPEKIILFGGPSCDSEMGLEMARAFDCVDIVTRGEADTIITPLVRAIRSGKPLDLIPGIAFVKNGRLHHAPPNPPLSRLDDLPYPDYEDFILQIRNFPDYKPGIYFETSRGCWWGQKHLCSFCGLNANGLAFRRKSPERAVAEILELSEYYGINRLIAADNILDFSYFDSVLQELARVNTARHPDDRLVLFYELKSNVKKNQLSLMRAAGISEVQPGIESFSDHVLSLMQKGATGIQQVQFLKWAEECAIAVQYGILYHNPGEKADDYDEMLRMIPYLRHLPPPSYVTPMVLDRFSPYFENPSAYGIRNIEPDISYRWIFPDERVDIGRIGYRFTYEHDDQHDSMLQSAVARCVEEFLRWRDGFQPYTLLCSHGDGCTYIMDRRYERPTLTRLTGFQSEIFRHCDEIHSFAEIRRRFSSIEEGRLRTYLELLVSKKWFYRDRHDRYLALPVERALAIKREHLPAANELAAQELPA